MAVLFMNGYDWINDNGVATTTAARTGLTSNGGNFVFSSVLGRGNGGAVGQNSAGTLQLSVAPAGGTTVIFGTAYQPNGGGYGRWSILNTTSQVIARLDVSTTGTISVYRGDGTTLLGTSAGTPITYGAWNYLEFRFVSSATVGEWVVDVGGVNVINLTGQNTQGQTGNIAAIRFGTQSAQSATHYIDDTYAIDSGSFWGDTRVVAMIASDAGANTGWTGTGTPWQDIADISVEGANYISASTATTKSTFSMKQIAPVSPNATFSTNSMTASSATSPTTILNDYNGSEYMVSPSTALGRYLQYDFGSAQQIYGVHFLMGTSNAAAAFNFDGSNDGTTWTTLASGASGTYTTVGAYLRSVVSYRYYRVISTSTSGVAWRVYDFILFGPTTFSTSGRNIQAVNMSLDTTSTTGAAIIQPMVRISGTDYTMGGTISLPAASAAINRNAPIATSPATAGGWSAAEIAAAEFGLRFES